MIGIDSFGNQIRRGTYTRHSTFASAANFILDDVFAFLVDPHVGAGPLNIVLHGCRPDAVRSLLIEYDCVRLNGEVIPLDGVSLYNANIDLAGATSRKLQNNLPYLERAIVTHAPQKSLAFLIDPKRRSQFHSSFDRAAADRLEAGMKLLMRGAYRAGTEMMKGVGCGLTPAGDDFLSGYLIALNVCREISSTDVSRAVATIHHSARGGNVFVNNFLECAARGQISGTFKGLLHALCCLGEDDVSIQARRLLSIGATSGADQAVGFLVGMKRISS